MKRIWKKGISWFLALVMVIGVMPMSAFAAEVSAENLATAQVGDTHTVSGSTEAPATAPEGTHWEGPVKSDDYTCGKDEHTHVDGCYVLDVTNPVCGHSHGKNCFNAYMPCMKSNCTKKHVIVLGYLNYHEEDLNCGHHVNTCFGPSDVVNALTCPTNYAHTHDDITCYSYTWTLTWNVYDVHVTVTGKDGVTPIGVPATATHGTDVTFKLPATGDVYTSWTAKIGENAYPLSATEDTVVTAKAITSGEIVVELTSEPVPTYSVTVVEENKFDGCSCTIDKAENLLAGATVELDVSVPESTTSAMYGYTIDVSEGATINGNRVTVGSSDVTVTITYSRIELTGKQTGEILFNKNVDATALSEEELGALKKSIFDSLEVKSLPEGATSENVEIKYDPWYQGKITQEYNQNGDPVLLNETPEDSLLYTGFAFGKSGNPETVIISYQGVSISAVLTLLDGRPVPTIQLNSGVSFTYSPSMEKEAVFDEIFEAVLVEGEAIAYDDSYLSYEVSGLTAGNQTVTVTYSDSGIYQAALPATMEFEIKQAPVEITVNSQTVKYGAALENFVTTDPTIDTYQFVLGLDVSKMYLENGEKLAGYETEVNLVLPFGLDDILANLSDEKILGVASPREIASALLTPIFEDLSAGVDAGELAGYLDTLKEYLPYLGMSAESLDILVTAMTSLEEQLDGVIIKVNAPLPSDIGVYVVGAVTGDSNYETDLAVGYLVITPDGHKATLDWKFQEENGFVTLPALQSGEYDLGAYVTAVAEGTKEEAEAALTNLFLGVNADGEIVITEEQAELSVGAYAEVAYVFNWGNVIYYAEPIARAFAVVPELVDVKFVDETGAPNNDRLFTFTNEAHDLKYTIDGVVSTNATSLNYIGIQTNGKVYNSTVAPKHSGAYTAVVTYSEKNDAGEYIRGGVDAAVMVIKPTTATIKVTGKEVLYNEAGHTVQVEVTSAADENLTVDYTLISGGATVSGDIDEVGLDAFHGNVNIDFPRWLDEALSKYDLYNGGVNKNSLASFINANRAELVSFVSEKVSKDIPELDAYIDELLTVLGKLPQDVALTFENNKTYTEPGYYFFYGIVTDSDHLPAADTGLVHIYKEVNNFDLKDTTVCYDGTEKWVEMDNDAGADYLALVINRADNSLNILLEDDVMAMLEKLPIDLPDSVTFPDLNGLVDTSAVVDALEEIVGKLIEKADALNLSSEFMAVLESIQAELAARENMPKATITINGALPTAIGTYECYAISYSEAYQLAVSEGSLTINPHVEVVDEAVPPTCTEDGLTEGKHCDVCKEVLVAQTTDPKLDHAYGDWAPVDADNHKHVCRNDANHVETDAHDWESASDTVCDTCGYTRTVGGGGSSGGGGGAGDAGDSAGDRPAIADPTVTGVVDYLNTDSHSPFMVGDDKGNFRPNANITRGEVAQIFYALLKDKNVTITASFDDVESGIWYETAVNTLASMGIVSGIGDGKFEPDRPITRAEFAAIAAKFAKKSYAGVKFDDVAEDHWAYPGICTAASYGWVTGIGDNKFGPTQKITRAEVATIVNHMLGRLGDWDAIDNGECRWFPDVTKSHWAWYEIGEATTDHDYKFNSKRTEETWK